MKEQSEQRKREYKAFIASGTWKAIRRDAIARGGNICEWCKRSGEDVVLHVHHKTYARFGGNEAPGDLQVLCGMCHAEAHGVPYLLCLLKDQRKGKTKETPNGKPTDRQRRCALRKARRKALQARIKAKMRASAIETPSLKDRF